MCVLSADLWGYQDLLHVGLYVNARITAVGVGLRGDSLVLVYVHTLLL